MVGGSELPFRMLCRRYGADLCYTPMIYSGKFVHDEEYRQQAFNTTAGDRPLVAHFCGNNPQVLLQAARLVEVRRICCVRLWSLLSAVLKHLCACSSSDSTS